MGKLTTKDLPQEVLKELLVYDSGTGIFTWNKYRNSKAVKGGIAGGINPRGYRVIKVNNKTYKEHRLAWLYEYGYFPECDIDHINRDKGDNRLCNLREVSRSCNVRNIGNISSNTSGIKGVRKHNQMEQWVVRITANNKDYYLGCYKDFTEAVCHRLAVEQCLGWDNCDCLSPAQEYVASKIERSAA